ncbi:lipopolysaccharide transport periplasmic protein LptA [Celeribacter litoreus]|uniref:lipopolysaccharide transport periplasmic protein LptA n=1 Tax=Celeribacter litoreus TaxID=2876714 RepID=UPI001CCE744B|nr:lipopolysaccharide transport periplasmic protein LptA [Celeribacter litoreus]MCA0042080.1 lipopolysaccharide transport periplasmic protein LptA [Celeribacter litoreus]
MALIRKHFSTLALALAFSFSTAPALYAQSSEIAFGGVTHDSSQPIEIASDELSVDQATGEATFSGDVEILQGTLTLTSQLVQVVYAEDSQAIARLIASGGVTVSDSGDFVEASNAEYDLESGNITLTGNVLLTQRGSAMSGQKLVLNLETGTGRMDGRVKTILQTGTNQ